MRTLDEIYSGMSETLFYDMCSLDFSFFSERVLGLECPEYQITWMNIVHKYRYVLLEAFRGSGKTLILGCVYPLWLSRFRKGSHILYSASSFKQATKILDETKEMIDNNEFLLKLKGENPKFWNEGHAKCTNGSEFFCRAYTNKIKGVHVNYAFIDEVQDVPMNDVFDNGVMPTVNNKNGHMVCVGVSDSPGDMVENLKARRNFKSLSLPVLLGPGVSAWPERYPLSKIDEIRNSSTADSWNTQYLLKYSLGGEHDVFPLRWINNCYSSESRFSELLFENGIGLIGLDFAMSESAGGDFDCFEVIEKYGGKVYLRHGERHKGLSVDAKKDRIRYLFKLYKPLMMYADISGVGNSIVSDLRNEGYPIMGVSFDAKNRYSMLVNLQTLMMPNKSGSSLLVLPLNKNDADSYAFVMKLTEELIGFKEKKSDATGVKLFSSTAAHDDTVAALCLACSGAVQIQEFVNTICFG